MPKAKVHSYQSPIQSFLFSMMGYAVKTIVKANAAA